MRALISVNIKDGITEFARKLEEMHFEIVTAGATYEILKKRRYSGIKCFRNNSL